MDIWWHGYKIERMGQRYLLKEELGSGGMATVYLAWDEQESRQVAIKVIKPEKLDSISASRFLKEGMLIARWKHPYIVKIYDVELDVLDQTHLSILPYLVMEYAPGPNLQQRLKAHGRFPLHETRHIFAQLCDAVQYAHAQDILHRDIKPSNVLFRSLPDGSEQVILSDFGLAVLSDTNHPTYPGGGTPAYMPLEQHQGHAQKASDIFALGVILYQLCTGTLPFPHPLSLLKPPPLPSTLNPALPVKLDEVILTALATNPDQRFPTAHQLKEQVELAFEQEIDKTVTTIPLAKPQPVDNPPLTRQSTKDENIKPPSTPTVLPTTASVIHPPTAVEILEGPKSIKPLSPRKLRTAYKPGGITDTQRGTATTQGANGIVTTPTSVLKISKIHNISRLQIYGIAFIVLLFLSCSGLAYGKPYLITAITHFNNPFASSLATIIITPQSHQLTNSYIVTGVTSTPNQSALQISARTLSASQSYGPITVNGTGKGQGATQATGMLTFTNFSTVGQIIEPNAIIFVTASGVQVKSDAVVRLLAGTFANGNTETVAAHALVAGSAGNIPALSVNQTCCVYGGSGVRIQNQSAFTGGQDVATYTFVSQDDVKVATNGKIDGLTKQALNVLKGKIATNEVQVAQPQCIPTVNAAGVGNLGVTASNKSILVSVTVNCTVTVYNHDQVASLSKAQLQGLADKTYGPGYVLTGNVLYTISQQQPLDNAHGILNMVVDAKGIWFFKGLSNPEQQQALARLIMGLSPSVAKVKLLANKAIADVTIQLKTGITLIPSDITQISFIIKPVAGLVDGTGTNATPISLTSTINEVANPPGYDDSLPLI